MGTFDSADIDVKPYIGGSNPSIYPVSDWYN